MTKELAIRWVQGHRGRSHGRTLSTGAVGLQSRQAPPLWLRLCATLSTYGPAGTVGSARGPHKLVLIYLKIRKKK